MLGVLADEHDEAAKIGRAPPHGNQRFVAQELVVVLVDAAGAVVLDEDAHVAIGGGDVEERVGLDRAEAVVVDVAFVPAAVTQDRRRASHVGVVAAFPGGS